MNEESKKAGNAENQNPLTSCSRTTSRSFSHCPARFGQSSASSPTIFRSETGRNSERFTYRSTISFSSATQAMAASLLSPSARAPFAGMTFSHGIMRMTVVCGSLLHFSSISTGGSLAGSSSNSIDPAHRSFWQNRSKRLSRREGMC